MAVLGTNNLTLTDRAKRTDPEGNVPVVAELLSNTNEILDDCVWKESNMPTGERVVIRTGLPAVYWRALNQGVPGSKSTTRQVDESCAILEARSTIDKEVALLNGNTSQFRMSEDVAFIESMNQKQAETMFYGNPAVDPKQYLGLAARYSAISGGPANATNILSAGGSTSVCTSVYLVCWGDNTVYGTFPKGTKAGLTHQNLGEITDYSSGLQMQAYSTLYQWKCGLVVKDWRYVVRIANIDTDALVAQTGTQATTAATMILKLMAKAVYKLPSMTAGRCAFYMNRTVHAGMSMLAMEKASNVLAFEEGVTQYGQPHAWMTFMGIPLRKTDALLNTEAVVS